MTIGRICLFSLMTLTALPAFGQQCTKPKVLILLDISGSMLETSGGQTKYAQAKAGLTAALDNLQDKGKFGLMVFPSTPAQTQPSGYCWTSADVAVSFAEGNQAQIATFLNASDNQPHSSYDTPIYQALTNIAYLTEQPDIVLLITDGQQDCPGGINYGDYDNDPDHSPNTRPGYGAFIPSEKTQNRIDVGDVTAYLAHNNIKVFSIGFSANADAATLNLIAVNGNTRRSPTCNANGTSSSDSNRCYYQANNTSELQSTLQTILFKTSNEICNNLDDDCDGWIDEDDTGEAVLTRTCANGCGMVACVDGNYEACQQPQAEQCNNYDDDCDGLVDNVADIVCEGGTKKCIGGVWVAQDSEICDGKDNDCDSQIDEAPLDCPCTPNQTKNCGYAAVGACSPGTATCGSDYHWGACVGGQGPTDEVCDGIDNDCDEVIDDITGDCKDCRDRPGHLVCVPGMGPKCMPINPPLDECNGVDDDCDGSIDEDGDQRGSGVCGDGVQHCVAGMLQPVVYDNLPAEICNGRDDNCDGITDPDCGCKHGTVDTCDGGSKCGMGTKKCEFGRWTACVGAPSTDPEICDGADNNCNGAVDEEVICPTAGESCVCGHCVPACNADGSCANGAACINGMCEIGGCSMAPPSEPNPPEQPALAGEKPRAVVRGGCDCASTPDTATVLAYAIATFGFVLARKRRKT